LVDRPPAGPGWLHEVKHDGFWILARKEGEGQVKIWSRRRWPPKACELGLEGIVSKRQGSFYKSGPSRNWLKTVNPDFVRT
jgi:ATP-dependent DNA ligase